MIQYTLGTKIDSRQPVSALAYSLDGRFLAAGVPDGVRVYRPESGQLFLRIYTLSAVLCLCWDSKGNLICGCQSGYLAVISIDLGSRVSNDISFV